MATKDSKPDRQHAAEGVDAPLETTPDMVPADNATPGPVTPDVELAPTKREKPAADAYQDKMTTTRSGAIWTTTIFSLIVLILLIIFIAQNQETTTLRYFAWEGTVNVGLTVLAAAVAGGVIVALAGAGRIIALKAQKRHQRKASRQNGS
ncbi:LapA family protein [Zhihengliuella halotolerans]|uniref:LapA family protein n=1 Tax=Zhihengliuella halotolerans TaxID=370736 RepID=UPI000C7FB75B|nr:LapA family protein [Zhihengliuella halotolerans]